VIPNFTRGLGGHMTIFRTIDFLERCGHDCTIWVHSEMKGEKPSRLSSLHKRIIDQYFIKLKTDQVYMLGNTNEDLERVSGDVVIATDRMSAYPVLGMRKFSKRFYFVQDYEPFFFAKGTSTILTEQTYSSNHEFACICASPWLKNMMIEQGNPAISFPLAVDSNTYHHPKLIKGLKIPSLFMFVAAHHVAYISLVCWRYAHSLTWEIALRSLPLERTTYQT